MIMIVVVVTNNKDKNGVTNGGDNSAKSPI